MPDDNHGDEIDLHPESNDATDAVVDPWKQHEDAGYSPWLDSSLQSQPVVFSAGSSTFVVSSEGEVGSGAFYANLAAIHNNDEEDDETRSHEEVFIVHNTDVDSKAVASENSSKNYSDYTPVPIMEERGDGEEPEIPDFRAVADRALSLLDREYEAVFSANSCQDGLEQCSIKPLETIDDQKMASVSATENGKQEFVEIETEAKVAAATEGAEDFASFSTANLSQIASMYPEEKVLPQIDTEAVARAVSSLSLFTNSDYQSRYQDWHVRQQQSLVVIPRLHSIIPSQSLSAFRKKSDKAVAATHKLSRSASIAEAIHRLNLLQSQPQLTIHIVGCDQVECSSIERVRFYMDPIVKWLGDAIETPRCVQLHLIGPSIPENMGRGAEIDLFPAGDDGSVRLDRATAFCYRADYSEWLQERVDRQASDLIIAFNAGVWGYNEWRFTIRDLIARKRRIPFVVTAYTLLEAEEDKDVLEEELGAKYKDDFCDGACIWKPEINIFSSRQERPTATAVPGRQYRENAAWQAWRI